MGRINRGHAGIHPVVLAAGCHDNLVAIHPFVDSNGRTAGLMMKLVLLRAGFPLAVIEVGERASYLAALDEANEGRADAFAGLVIAAADPSLRRLWGD